MTKELIPIPKGMLLTITVDAYSSYTVSGVFRAREVIDADALRREWLLLHPEQLEQFEEDQFIAWLVVRGLLEPVDCMEWHLHDWGAAMCMTVERYEP